MGPGFEAFRKSNEILIRWACSGPDLERFSGLKHCLGRAQRAKKSLQKDFDRQEPVWAPDLGSSEDNEYPHPLDLLRTHFGEIFRARFACGCCVCLSHSQKHHTQSAVRSLWFTYAALLAYWSAGRVGTGTVHAMIHQALTAHSHSCHPYIRTSVRIKHDIACVLRVCGMTRKEQRERQKAAAAKAAATAAGPPEGGRAEEGRAAVAKAGLLHHNCLVAFHNSIESLTNPDPGRLSPLTGCWAECAKKGVVEEAEVGRRGSDVFIGHFQGEGRATCCSSRLFIRVWASI